MSVKEDCPVCKHFVGCECFDGHICDKFETKKTRITTEREAIEYIENLLKNWSSWKEHHIALVQSLEIILAKIKEASKND